MKKSTLFLYYTFLVVLIIFTLLFVILQLWGGALGTGFASIIVFLQIKKKKESATNENN